MDLKILLDTPPWEWPRDAGKIFHRILTDPHASPSDRLAAADMAGNLVVMNDQLADALLVILRDATEPDDLRATAAIAFGPVLERTDTSGFDDPHDEPPISRATFETIRETLHKLYLDESLPKEVRRRILEGSVRSHDAWHKTAIRTAYASGDREWMLTAVFGMRWIRGFEKQILDALQSNDSEIHCEAVHAAGNWELDPAWSHVVTLVEDPDTPKPLLLAAIGAVGGIRPQEATEILEDLADSGDPEIAEAAEDAISMAEAMSGPDIDDNPREWIN